MYAPRADGILESERQEFLATRMWIGMGLANQAYDSTLAMMDPELMCDYPPVMNDYMALQQVMPPTQAMQERPKEIKVQPRFNPSTRGRRSDPNRNFFGTGRGRGTKEGSYKQSINPSKRHRDRLNSELDNLAKLLPFSEDIIARLDKLSILRLSVSYLRNKNFFKASLNQQKAKATKDVAKSVNRDSQFAYLFNEAIDGFILVITLNGEIFFVSESVKDHLGYSQSQVLHQPLETLVHDDDRDDLLGHLKGSSTKIEELKEGGDEQQAALLEELAGQSRDFVIRLKSVMNTSSSDMYKPYKLSGTIRALNIEPEVESLKYALFAFCTPARTSHSMLEIRMKTTLFCSKNRIDLSFLDMDARGKEFFGYSKKDIFGRSSYVLVHRFDLRHLRCKHTEIMTCGKSSIGTFRLMSKNHEWSWICGYARVVYKNGKPDYVVTTNRVMGDKEGQAMLKFRDDVDYKALSQLGLIEPDDPTKAIELGFPEHPSSKSIDMHADNQPLPMMLGEFLGADIPGAMMQPPVQPKTESVELMKGSLFDVDVHEQRSYWTGDNTFMGPPGQSSYPSCEVSSDNFQPTMSCQSPTGSNLSGHTHHTHGSTHSNSSAGGNDQINFDNKTEAFQNMSPSYPSAFQQQQQQLHHSHPLKPVHTDINSSSCSIPRPPTQTTPQLAHMPETSLFDHLTNLDLVQQQIQNSHQSRTQQSIRYPYVPNPAQTSTNEYYRQQKIATGGQYPSTDYNCIRTQCDPFENRIRTECNPFENRTPLYDQIGPNVVVSSPGYDISTDTSMHGPFEYNAQRSQMNSSRQYGYGSSFMDNRNNSQSSSTRPPVGLHPHHNMFNYNFIENSSLSPPQQFLPGGTPYTSWTQM